MVRTVDCKVNVLRGGGIFTQLRTLDAPEIRMDDGGEIKMSMSLECLADDSINWLSDELQPVLIINGEEYPLGVFLPATVTDGEDETTKSVRVEAYDRCWRVRDTRLTYYRTFAAGTNYLTAVKTLLGGAGVTVIIETPTTATLSEIRADWDIGASFLEIVNQLLSEINYKPLWFNEQGAAVLEPVSVPTAENIKHTLDGENVRSMLAPEIQRELDIYSAPNVFTVICSNADKSGPMVATARNTNPQSPLSTMRRGREIVCVYNVDNIASQSELQAYANRLRDESMYSGETIRVTTALFPGWGVDDVTALHYKDLSCICIEKAWTMRLEAGGPMTHTLERVVHNLG